MDNFIFFLYQTPNSSQCQIQERMQDATIKQISSLAISQQRVHLTASTKHMSCRLSEETLQATTI